MTNETKASQPMQELVRDLYNFEGGRHFALRLEKLIASQPKSIGDDAQFRNALSTWYRAKSGASRPQKVERDFAALIAAIDNFRAPAAQASASIQAAPETCTGCDNPAGPQTADSYGFCKDCMEFSGNIAATIQEIVAEPVGVVLQARSPLGDPWQEVDADNFYKAQANGYETRVLHLAAPMVADPAGVADSPIGYISQDALTELQDPCAPAGSLLTLRHSKSTHRRAEIPVYLAATVKAVSKIRITLPQARRLVDFFGGHDADVTVTERPADWEQVEEGLYAFCTEYPEDGAQFLGATEVDDELMRLGTVKAVPSEALDADGRIAELEGLLQVAAQGLRFRAKDNNGDEALKPIWEYMVKHHPEYDGRLSGWASMRPNWQSTDSGHAYGCQCAACKAKRSGAAPLADKTGGGA